MVSLRWLAIVMVSLLCREIAGCEPSLPWAVAWSSALGLSLGFGLLVKSFALASLRQDLTSSVQRGLVAQSFQQRRRLAEVLWCFFLPAALLASGWATWFNRLEQDGLPRTLAVLGCFLPSLFLVLLVEVTAAQLDAILDQCEEGYRTDSAEGWLEHFRTRLRLGDLAGLMACVAPVGMIAFVRDALQACQSIPWLAELDPHWLATVLSLLGLTALLLALPRMLSIWSGAERIVEPELKQRIQIHLQRTGVRGVEALMVPSHQRWAGAAIVGAIPGFRKLWLGDATIELLNDRELDMVILHELSHVQRRHFLWRMLPILFIAWLVACVWAAVPAMVSHAATQAVVQLALLSLAGGLLVATLGNLAKLCEFDADRYACQLAKRSCEWSDSIAPGLVLASALARLIPADSPAALTTWLHPSLADRLEQLMLQPG